MSPTDIEGYLGSRECACPGGGIDRLNRRRAVSPNGIGLNGDLGRWCRPDERESNRGAPIGQACEGSQIQRKADL